MKKVIWAWDGSVLKEVTIKKDAPASESEGLKAKVRQCVLNTISNFLANIIVLAMFIALTMILYAAVTWILRTTALDLIIFESFF